MTLPRRKPIARARSGSDMTTPSAPKAGEDHPPIGYSLEGEGVVATCKRCGAEAWKPTRQEAETWGREHAKCRADLVALYGRLQARRRPAYARRRA